MTLYLVIIVVLMFVGVFDLYNLRKDQKILLYSFLFLVLVLLDGVRWETGTDWDLYYSYFQDPTAKGFNFEPGYQILNQVIHKFSLSYSFFIVTLAIIYYSLYLKSINDYAIFPFITLLLFFSIFVGYMGMNRQHIALALCLYSLKFIITENYWKFLFCISFASLFHTSALIFIITYFLNRNFPAYLYVVSICVVYLLNPVITNILNPMISIMPVHYENKLQLYLLTKDTNSTIGIVFGTLKRAFIFLPLFHYKDRLKVKFPNIELFLNIYFLALIIYVLFNNSIQVIVARGNLYFGSLTEIFLIPLFLIIVKPNAGRLLMYLLIILLALLTFFKSISTEIELFIPYKSFFS